MIMKAGLFCIVVVVEFLYHMSALPLHWKRSFAAFKQTKLYIGSNDINPLPALVEKLSTSSGQNRLDALDTVYRIAIGDQDYKRSMNTKQDGLLPILVSIISSDSGRARERALEIL